ncbi:ornithine decarboxylase antizyme like [Lecanosticta acicola]|uniref:Ornithine decarboxylase antizyme n=1 Tax=Lecanosticta acicola TaxID=111012 RepID=A0AAI8YV43_9PEZI|nr:ornithine decarboxylase antizyme like [Lecanosticta acicola]
MAMLYDCNHSKSNSSYARKTSTESARRSNTQASAYAVNASTMALSGFHFSTCGAGGAVPLGGVPSPPPSPHAAPLGSARPGLKARKRSGDACNHITEECERLFCETLKTVFLVEKGTGLENSLVMDLRNSSNSNSNSLPNGSKPIPQPPQNTRMEHGLPTPSPSPDGRIWPKTGGLIKDHVEVWDYVGGARFRGFVAEKRDVRSMLVFFDKEVIGLDLKPGLMSLLELASSDHFDCSQLIICVDRTADEEEVQDLTKSLGWVGFELSMLEDWTPAAEGCISDQYIFLGMDV